MWSNRENAEEALGLARKKLSEGDTAGAMKWVEKSLHMYETVEAREVERKIQERVAHMAAARRVLEAADLFEVLGVTRTATAAEIKQAFKRLSREVHPDKNGADEAVEAFKRLNEAHSTLSDPVLRDGYVQRTPMSVWDVLTSMNLAAYADEFNRQGYNDLEVLIMMSKKGQLAQIADNVHMKSGHKSKFLEKLHALETARGTPPPGFRPKS